MAADRATCWCHRYRKPCQYHEGIEDGREQAQPEIEKLHQFINDLDIQIMHPDMGGNHQCSIRMNGRTMTHAQWGIVYSARFGDDEVAENQTGEIK